jgi:predicted site-specific integrase-resolvase
VPIFRAIGNAAASNSPRKQVTVEQQQGKRRTSSGERAQVTMTNGAAIYARFSSENQREASIDDQIRVCTAYLARDGKSVVETYADYAVSGATTLRPGYQALLRDARARRFDVVIAESLDLFNRDQEHIAAFYKHMTFAGVSIVTLAEGTITELHVGLKGTMSALFSRIWPRRRIGAWRAGSERVGVQAACAMGIV